MTAKVLTLKQVAQLTGISQRDLKVLYNERKVEITKVGNAVCITEDQYNDIFGSMAEQPDKKDGNDTLSERANHSLTKLADEIGIGDIETVAKLCKSENITVWLCFTEDNPDGRFLQPKDYQTMVDKYAENPALLLRTKQQLKNQAKSKVKRKFKVGEHISLKLKIKGGDRDIIKGFRVVKFVYTINNYEANILILKQISGPQRNIYTLNRHDCRKLHIKYQPGLQVFSMFMNWGRLRTNKKGNK